MAALLSEKMPLRASCRQMGATAIISFWLRAHVLPPMAGFGMIHLPSIWAICVLVPAVYVARRGDIALICGACPGLR